MLSAASYSLAVSVFDLFRFGSGRGGAEFVLLLVGLGFAGVLVWAIERGGRRTT